MTDRPMLPTDDTIFNLIRTLLETRTLKAKELSDLLAIDIADIKRVLLANPYAFDYRLEMGSRIWRNL